MRYVSDLENILIYTKSQNLLVLLIGVDISLSHDFKGLLTITIPVDVQYNGKEAEILHCANGTLKTYTATVEEGKATFTVSELSPFAVFAEIEEVPPTGVNGRSGNLALWLCLLTLGALGISLATFWQRKPGWDR